MPRYGSMRATAAKAPSRRDRSSSTVRQMGFLKSLLGRTADVSQAADTADQHSPAAADTAKMRGNRHLADGDFDEAAACYREALRLDPNFAEAYNNLGYVLKEQHRFVEAKVMLETALRLRPDLGPARLNMGIVLHALHDDDQAEDALRRAARLMPGNPECHWRLGDLLFAVDRCEAAVTEYQAALQLEPQLPETRVNLGSACHKLGRRAEAETHYLAALNDFGSAQAAHYLGVIRHLAARHDEAIAYYRRATQLDPGHIQSHWNLAYLMLLRGDYSASAWRHFEMRLHAADLKDPTLRAADVARYMPRFGFARYWNGGDLEGKTLLVWTEQGFGDTLMTMRFMTLLKARGAGKVVLYADAPLVRLALTLNDIDLVIAKNEEIASGDFDFHVSAMSLPALFQADPASISSMPSPYLVVRQEDRRKWEARLSAGRDYRIGIVWAGNPDMAADTLRSVALEKFLPLTEIRGTAWVSLQKGEPARQRAAGGERIADWMDECVDMYDTATLIDGLDLVISVDTSIAHLAGALGKPVWLLNRYDSEWRWMWQREDSPWYPSMRIFSQPAPHDWDSVIAKIAAELRRLLAERTQ